MCRIVSKFPGFLQDSQLAYFYQKISDLLIVSKDYNNIDYLNIIQNCNGLFTNNIIGISRLIPLIIQKIQEFLKSKNFNSMNLIITQCLAVLSQITSRVVYFEIDPNDTMISESEKSKELFYVINDYITSSKVLEDILNTGIMYENRYNYETNMWIFSHYLLGLENSQGIVDYMLTLCPEIIRKEKEFLNGSEIPHHIFGILYFMELCANFLTNQSLKNKEDLLIQIPYTLIQIMKEIIYKIGACKKVVKDKYQYLAASIFEVFLIFCNLLAWSFDESFFSVYQFLSFENLEENLKYLKQYYDFTINVITLNHSRIRLGNCFNFQSTSFLSKEKILENSQIYSNDLNCLHAFGSSNIIISCYTINQNHPQDSLILIRNPIGVFSYTSSQIYPNILVHNLELSMPDEKEFKLEQEKILGAERVFQDIPHYDDEEIIAQKDFTINKAKADEQLNLKEKETIPLEFNLGKRKENNSEKMLSLFIQQFELLNRNFGFAKFIKNSTNLNSDLKNLDMNELKIEVVVPILYAINSPGENKIDSDVEYQNFVNSLGIKIDLKSVKSGQFYKHVPHLKDCSMQYSGSLFWNVYYIENHIEKKWLEISQKSKLIIIYIPKNLSLRNCEEILMVESMMLSNQIKAVLFIYSLGNGLLKINFRHNFSSIKTSVPLIPLFDECCASIKSMGYLMHSTIQILIRYIHQNQNQIPLNTLDYILKLSEDRNVLINKITKKYELETEYLL